MELNGDTLRHDCDVRSGRAQRRCCDRWHKLYALGAVKKSTVTRRLDELRWPHPVNKYVLCVTPSVASCCCRALCFLRLLVALPSMCVLLRAAKHAKGYLWSTAFSLLVRARAAKLTSHRAAQYVHCKPCIHAAPTRLAAHGMCKGQQRIGCRCF